MEIDLGEMLTPKRIAWGIGLIVAAIGAWTSFYTIQAESQGVVLRFGKYVDTVDPGLHFKLPFGIDHVEPLLVKRTLKQEFGFSTEGATNESQTSNPAEQEDERSMITGDLNTAVVEWVVQYRISDPKLFLFKVQNPEDTLRDLSEGVMRTVVGDRTVDEVITFGRQDVEDKAREGIKERVAKYELGIQIDQIQLKNVNPPPSVQASFREVDSAKQEKKRLKNVAEGQLNREIPLAKGVALQDIEAAKGYAKERNNEALGDVAKFNAVFKEYLKAPEVTKQRLYLETMKDVIPLLGRKIIIDQDASQILPLLQLQMDQPGGQRR